MNLFRRGLAVATLSGVIMALTTTGSAVGAFAASPSVAHQGAQGAAAHGTTKVSLSDQVVAQRSAALRLSRAAKPVQAAVSTMCGTRNPLPNPPGGAPWETWSRYINATDIYQMGFDQGCTSDTQRNGAANLYQIAILDFGDPGRGSDGRYGAWDRAGYHPIGSPSETGSIEYSVVRYMQGFWNGTVAGSGSFMTVMVGTNNHKYNANGSDNGAPVDYAHGQAWAHMVNDLNAYINSAGWGTQLAVEAADDMETSWAYYSQTLDWANGFASVGGASYYDYGDAGGCPSGAPGNCSAAPIPNGGWSSAGEYTLAWGLQPAFAIPEIYFSVQAYQWYQISLAGVNAGHTAIYFTAAMSEHNACGNCNEYTYYQSWSELQNVVNANSRTNMGRIPYTTEMSYTNP
jgi:hypothetical protein